MTTRQQTLVSKAEDFAQEQDVINTNIMRVELFFRFDTKPNVHGYTVYVITAIKKRTNEWSGSIYSTRVRILKRIINLACNLNVSALPFGIFETQSFLYTEESHCSQFKATNPVFFQVQIYSDEAVTGRCPETQKKRYLNLETRRATGKTVSQTQNPIHKYDRSISKSTRLRIRE